MSYRLPLSGINIVLRKCRGEKDGPRILSYLVMSTCDEATHVVVLTLFAFVDPRDSSATSISSSAFANRSLFSLSFSFASTVRVFLAVPRRGVREGVLRMFTSVDLSFIKCRCLTLLSTEEGKEDLPSLCGVSSSTLGNGLLHTLHIVIKPLISLCPNQIIQL